MSTQPQTGVTATANSHALFLTFNQTRAPHAVEQVRSVVAQAPDLQKQINQQHPGADLHLVVAIGSAYWDIICEGPRPTELQAFPAMENGLSIAPSTPVDLLFHIRSERHDLNFQLANNIQQRLQSAMVLVEDIHGFRYLDSRDLTGFVDGTENPEGAHRHEVAVVNDDTEFAGGSYIHIQRYEHDLPIWDAQPLKTQEDAIGRTKTDNIEYASADKPATAHVKRASVKNADGESLEILRHSMPYGTLKSCGLLFASYCHTPANFTAMLQSMVYGEHGKHSDELLKYTQAVTGHSFFAPSASFLQALSPTH